MSIYVYIYTYQSMSYFIHGVFNIWNNIIFDIYIYTLIQVYLENLYSIDSRILFQWSDSTVWDIYPKQYDPIIGSLIKKIQVDKHMIIPYIPSTVWIMI